MLKPLEIDIEQFRKEVFTTLTALNDRLYNKATGLDKAIADVPHLAIGIEKLTDSLVKLETLYKKER